jgi:hypothetical protein
VERWGRTLAEVLDTCRIGHLVEGSCCRTRVDFGMRGRILLVAVCLGATTKCQSPVCVSNWDIVLCDMPEVGGLC